MSDEQTIPDDTFPEPGDDCPNLLDLFDKMAEACDGHRLNGAAVILLTECSDTKHEVTLFTPGAIEIATVGALEVMKNLIVGALARGKAPLM